MKGLLLASIMFFVYGCVSNEDKEARERMNNVGKIKAAEWAERAEGTLLSCRDRGWGGWNCDVKVDYYVISLYCDTSGCSMRLQD